MIKKEINKWQMMFQYGRDPMRMERGWRFIKFGIFNFHRIPEQGVMFHSSDYRGFIVGIYIWLPFEINI